MLHGHPFRGIGLGLGLLGGAVVLVVGQDQVPPSARFRNEVVQQDPNFLLPEHVPAPDGQVTVFADFAHATTWVPVYVVNRSRRPLEWDCQSSDMGFKLETQAASGEWMRAQAHSFSWCGNSYYSQTLPAGQHWVLRGFQPAEGQRGPVRFVKRGESPVVSNSGAGLFSPSDVADAGSDALTGRAVPLHSASHRLEPANSLVKWPERVAALRMLATWEENRFIRTRVEMLTALAEKEASAESNAARLVMQEVLARPWPAKADARQFLREMVALLDSPKESSPGTFGALGDHRSVAWEALVELAWAATSAQKPAALAELTMTDWRPVAALACRQLGNEAEDLPRRLLHVPQIADECVADDFFAALLGSSNAHLRSMAAQTLARRENWSRLLEGARPLSSLARIDVLRALTGYAPEPGTLSKGPRSPRHDSAELKFWVECVQAEPLAAAAVLYTAITYGGQRNNPYPDELRQVLRTFLSREAARNETTSWDYPLPAGRWDSAIRLLALWRNREDAPLLGRFLQHRGYREEQAGTTIVRKYVLRRVALEGLGYFEKTAVPGLVLETTIPAKS